MKSDGAKWEDALLRAVSILDQEKVSYTISGETALLVQGIMDSGLSDTMHILVQWDAVENLYEKLQSFHPDPVDKDLQHARFSFAIDHITIELTGEFGTVIRTDPYRIPFKLGSSEIFVRSPYCFLNRCTDSDPLYLTVKEYLNRLQLTDSSENGQAWNEEAFQAWVRRFGTPEQAAEKIKKRSCRPAGTAGTIRP
jgi:hypothetical protein